MRSVLSLLATSLLVLVVNAEVAPAGQPVQLTIGTGQFCLAASGNTNGSPVISVDCSTSDPATRSWTVTKGGSTGNAPASTITIFGGTKCLDVTNGVNADGTKLQIFDCFAGNTNQLFNVHSLSSTASTITWTNKNKCVDLTNGNLTPGNVIQVWTCISGNTNQRWDPEGVTESVSPVPPLGSTRFELPIPSIHADGCITATDRTDGSPVIFHQCTFSEPGDSGPSESWLLTAGNAQSGLGPVGQVSTFGAINKCLTVPNGNTANGVKLVVSGCTPNNPNQLWQVNADLTIRWAGKGKCVDLTNGNLTNGNQLQSWDCTFNNHNQQWIPAPIM